MKARLEWVGGESAVIARMGFGTQLNMKFAHIAQQHMDKYIPYDPKRVSGIHMADNIEYRNMGGKNGGVGVVYKAPYARKQYYYPNHPMSAHSPLATDYWDVYCWELEKDEITAEVEAARKSLRRYR